MILTVVCVSMMSLFLSGCSKDKEETASENKVETKLNGDWNLKQVNFLSDEVVWNDSVDYGNIANIIGYAPFMLSEVWGYSFYTTNAKDKNGKLFFDTQGKILGKRAMVVQKRVDMSLFPGDYWYWSGDDATNTAKLTQINPVFPPYDFSLIHMKNLQFSDNDQTLTFDCQVNTRVVGGKMTDIIQIPVKITMKKEKQVLGVEFLLNGSPFELPE